MKVVRVQHCCDKCGLVLSDGTDQLQNPGTSITVVAENKPLYCSGCSTVVGNLNEWICLGPLAMTDVMFDKTGDGSYEVCWRTCRC